MTHPQRKGFGFVMVLVAISLTTSALVILSLNSVVLFHQANTDLAEANGLNLTASALAWAQAANSNTGDTVLDMTALNIPEGQAQVTIGVGGNGERTAKVAIQCRRGRIAVKRTSDHRLDGP